MPASEILQIISDRNRLRIGVLHWGRSLTNFLIATVAGALAGAVLAGSALAADIPAKAPPAAPSWSGFYAGVSLGARWATNDWQTSNVSPNFGANIFTPTAGTGGAMDSVAARLGGYLRLQLAGRDIMGRRCRGRLRVGRQQQDGKSSAGNDRALFRRPPGRPSDWLRKGDVGRQRARPSRLSGRARHTGLRHRRRRMAAPRTERQLRRGTRKRLLLRQSSQRNPCRPGSAGPSAAASSR